jgi:hypothetical protein
MAGPHDNQTRFEELLARGLNRSLRPPRNDCAEPATIAAYYARSLSAGETIRWEEHFATCASCQEQLAALVRTEDAESHATQPRATAWLDSWRLPVRIGVAGLAAAAALLVIILSYAPENRSPMPHPAIPPMELASRDATQSHALHPQETDNSAERALASRKEPEEKPQIAAENESPSAEPLAMRAAPPPAAAELGVGSGGTRPAGSAGRSASRLYAANPAAQQNESMVANRAVPQQASPLLPRAPNMISSPDGSVSWRIGPGGTIFRSHDSVNWRSQITGVKAGLTAGAAVSAAVCWVVGRGGTILRTLDGEHWQRVTAPTHDDLILVFAHSPSAATVVSDHGARFTTTDGGKTWKAE